MKKLSYRKRAFTLMELLIVCAIIAVLAAVATTSYKSAKIKSRDARRRSDIDTIAKAVELYHDQHNSYLIIGKNNVATGCGGGGMGDFNYSGNEWCSNSGGYPESINQGLVDAGFLSGTVQDPLDDRGCSSSDPSDPSYACQVYMFYFTENVDACPYAHLENASDADKYTTSKCSDNAPATPGSGNYYGMNYTSRVVAK